MPLPGTIALMGSGELADSMAEVHRILMTRLGEAPRPVFIDTPAGFELNIDSIGHKASAYFQRNFGLPLAVARYHRQDDPPEQVAAAVTAIRNANYLFAGPGSASYAVRLWRGSPVWSAIVERWQAGAMLVFSSAAALTLGTHTLPVYEIYKVGADPHWISGLDLFGTVGLRMAVVPHWNNSSGDQHDTRFCYMGAARMAHLEAALPPETTLLGIDEYAAAVIDPAQLQAEVLGAAQVTLHHSGRAWAYSKGQRFDLNEGQREAGSVLREPEPTPDMPEEQEHQDIAQMRDTTQQALETRDYPAAVQGLVMLGLLAGANLEQGVYNRAGLSVQALQALLPLLDRMKPEAPAADTATPLLDLLVALRGELRAAKQWALADQVRDGLAALGYTLADSPQGTRWKKSAGV
jgi:cyanophycinase-like exopeptidase